MTTTIASAPPSSSLRERSPRLLRVVNAAAEKLGGGRPWLAFEPVRTLLERARRRTGLDDFGDDAFRAGLEALAHSLEHEAGLSFVGRVMMSKNLARMLDNRLLVQRDRSLHPQIDQVVVHRPLIIVGLPRTGSTLLQRLLARDPAARSLSNWEIFYPSPPPEPTIDRRDPRMRNTRGMLQRLDWAAPAFSAAHQVALDEPEECVGLLQMSFATESYEVMARVPGYRAWLDRQDYRATYAYYRLQLQALQWRHAKQHWVLKSPFHLMGLEALLAALPDAVVVQTHREPAQVSPSMCALYSAMWAMSSKHIDRPRLGAEFLQRWPDAYDRVIELRARLGAERFMDVGYRELLADPFAVVRRIYDRFGYPLPPSALEAMRSWHGANPQHRHGVHRYSLDEYGLDEAMVNRRFARYRERFRDLL